jgi:hypothetical protein
MWPGMVVASLPPCQVEPLPDVIAEDFYRQDLETQEDREAFRGLLAAREQDPDSPADTEAWVAVAPQLSSADGDAEGALPGGVLRHGTRQPMSSAAQMGFGWGVCALALAAGRMVWSCLARTIGPSDPIRRPSTPRWNPIPGYGNGCPSRLLGFLVFAWRCASGARARS